MAMKGYSTVLYITRTGASQSDAVLSHAQDTSSTRPMDGSGPRSNEGVTPHSPDLRDWWLTIRCSVIYSHNKCAYINIYMLMQDTYWRNKLIRRSNKRRGKTSLTICTSLSLLQGFEKAVWGFTVRGSWRSNIIAIFWPLTLMAVTLCHSCSLGLLNRRPRAHSAGCWLSLLHLISIFSGPQLIRAQRPRRPDVAFLTTSPSNWLELYWQLRTDSNSTELYNGSTPTRSLKSHVWSSSSGNNCHAVHRSLSSGASVYERTMGFFQLVPFC